MLGFGPISGAPIGALPHEALPDIIEFVGESDDPLKDIREILIALKDATETQNYQKLQEDYKESRLKKWIPDTPEKLAAYASILAAVLNLISKDPAQNIQIGPTIVNQYQYIIESKTYFNCISVGG